mmetsp:Transcript_39323/g.111497  ORF Transcript_39323/g.111497 Transcript_39323/m.111497 type:complete len:323 (+) Transcript_39323:486-1454(+)
MRHRRPPYAHPDMAPAGGLGQHLHRGDGLPRHGAVAQEPQAVGEVDVGAGAAGDPRLHRAAHMAAEAPAGAHGLPRGPQLAPGRRRRRGARRELPPSGRARAGGGEVSLPALGQPRVPGHGRQLPAPRPPQQDATLPAAALRRLRLPLVARRPRREVGRAAALARRLRQGQGAGAQRLDRQVLRGPAQHQARPALPPRLAERLQELRRLLRADVPSPAVVRRGVVHVRAHGRKDRGHHLRLGLPPGPQEGGPRQHPRLLRHLQRQPLRLLPAGGQGPDARGHRRGLRQPGALQPGGAGHLRPHGPARRRAAARPHRVLRRPV